MTTGASRGTYRRMDDRLWDDVWERTLGHVERHHIARSVWSRAEPSDTFVAILGFELAHRWRARARNLAVVYGLWCLFWGAIAAVATGDPGGDVGLLPVVLTLVGVVAIGACCAVRARLRPVVDGRTGFAPPEPLPSER